MADRTWIIERDQQPDGKQFWNGLDWDDSALRAVLFQSKEAAQEFIDQYATAREAFGARINAGLMRRSGRPVEHVWLEGDVAEGLYVDASSVALTPGTKSPGFSVLAENAELRAYKEVVERHFPQTAKPVEEHLRLRRFIAAQGLLCPACGGTGRLLIPDNGARDVGPCLDCNGTGKAKEGTK